MAVLDIETISGEVMADNSFPPWPTHSPVVASILTADRDRDGRWAFGLTSVRFGEDPDPLETIDALCTGRSIVTFAGRNFDLPVLLLAGQRARAFHLRAIARAAAEPRFHSGLHYDLADRYSLFGGARGATLERLCEALDIPAKLTAHGDEVGAMYDAGEIEKIARYCEVDVASTLCLAAHMRAMETGNPAYHASLISQFVRWIREQGIEHLAPFTRVDDLDDLLATSLHGQIEVALANARTDAELRDKQRLDASFTETIHY